MKRCLDAALWAFLGPSAMVSTIMYVVVTTTY